jgi:hypothetical protein
MNVKLSQNLNKAYTYTQTINSMLDSTIISTVIKYLHYITFVEKHEI